MDKEGRKHAELVEVKPKSQTTLKNAGRSHAKRKQVVINTAALKHVPICEDNAIESVKTNILGHSDIAPLRKTDPGEKFPWGYLSSKSVGVYPGKIRQNEKHKKTDNFKGFYKNLQRIGYRYLNSKFRKKIIKNFQRRYRQKKVDGILDSETLQISEILARKSNIA